MTPNVGAAEPADAEDLVVIGPRPKWLPIDPIELWRYRELLWFLTLRDIQIRYKQTLLGALWALLQPLLTMVIFSVFFGRLAGIPADEGIPYPLFTLCALLPWQLFAHAVGVASNSLAGSERLITKVYFPRLILPLASMLSSVIDFCVALALFLAISLYYGAVPPWRFVLLPVLIVFALAAAFSIGVWLAAWNVRYRDVRYVLPFLTQIWLLATPVAYSSSIVPDEWRPLYNLNPMVGVVDGFRWALLDRAHVPDPTIWLSAAVVLVLLIGGLYYFRWTESSFADVI